MAVLFRRLTILVEPGHHHHNHCDNYDYIKDHVSLMKPIAGIIIHNDDLELILVDGMKMLV